MDRRLAPGLDREQFLSGYWQQKPLLLERAIENFVPPLTADELAGLALEESVESRIIERLESGWVLHHGPFEAADFRREQPWNLLVQSVDHHVPAVAELRKLVDIIPQWRVDDVMVSYANDGGSVGPHYDNYDVFLLQGEGRKRWQLGAACDAGSPLLPHAELRILETFDPVEEYTLNPGDMLYVPPGIAHCGTALGDSTTFSLGFRAPRIRDMLSRWADLLLEALDPELFYEDPGRSPQARPGEIPATDLARAAEQLQRALSRARENFWFGALVTEPRGELVWQDPEEGLALLRGRPQSIELSAAAKLAWQEGVGGTIQVFANGERRGFDGAVLPCLLQLCEHWQLAGTALEDAVTEPLSSSLLEFLLECGVIHVQ